MLRLFPLQKQRFDKAGLAIITTFFIVPMVLITYATIVSYYQRNQSLNIRIYSVEIIQNPEVLVANITLNPSPCHTETLITVTPVGNIFDVQIKRDWMASVDTRIIDVPHIQCTLYGIIRPTVATVEVIRIQESLPLGTYSLRVNNGSIQSFLVK